MPKHHQANDRLQLHTVMLNGHWVKTGVSLRRSSRPVPQIRVLRLGAPQKPVLLVWVFSSVGRKPPLKRPKAGRLNGAPDVKVFGHWEGLPGATRPLLHEWDFPML